MSIKYIIELLEPYLQIYADEGSAGVFYGDNEQLDTAQHNYGQIEIALEALSKIKE